MNLNILNIKLQLDFINEALDYYEKEKDPKAKKETFAIVQMRANTLSRMLEKEPE